MASTDGVNAFIQIYTNTTQISASSGSGPTGAGSAANPSGWNWIADGTCAWEWVGTIRGLDTAANMASAGILTYGTLASTTALFAHPKTIVPTLARPLMTITGGFPATCGSLVPATGFTASGSVVDATKWNLNITGNLGSHNGSGIVTFWTDADLIGFCGNAGMYPGEDKALFEINGRVLCDSLFGHATPAGNNGNNGIALNLSYWGKGTKKRIRIRFPWNGFEWKLLNSLIIESDASIWADPAPTWSMGWEGDSFSGGGNGVPLQPGQLPMDIVAGLLGCPSAYNNSYGGTGFLNNATTGSTYIQRLPVLLAYKPDVLVVGGCHNDFQWPTFLADQNTLTTAVVDYITAARRGLEPNAPIVLLGSNPLRGDTGGNYTQLQATETAMAAAVARVADPFVRFIPNTTDTTDAGPIFTGLGGSSNVPTFAGNADKCFSSQTGLLNNPDAHPISRGFRQIGYRWAKSIETALLDMLK